MLKNLRRMHRLSNHDLTFDAKRPQPLICHETAANISPSVIYHWSFIIFTITISTTSEHCHIAFTFIIIRRKKKKKEQKNPVDMEYTSVEIIEKKSCTPLNGVVFQVLQL